MPYAALGTAVRVRNVEKPLMDVIATAARDTVARQLKASKTKDLVADLHGDTGTLGLTGALTGATTGAC